MNNESYIKELARLTEKVNNLEKLINKKNEKMIGVELMEPVSLKATSFKIDFSKSKRIIGRNWYEPEEKGCWTGPELESSLLFKTLASGRYKIRLFIVGDITGDSHTSMKLNISNENIELTCSKENGAVLLSGCFEISDNYALPFIEAKFQFSQVKVPNVIDKRLLAIKFSLLEIEQIGS